MDFNQNHVTFTINFIKLLKGLNKYFTSLFVYAIFIESIRKGVGYKVNEGAAVLKRNGRIFISFSSSATDFNYCMGLLVADEDSDLLEAASWTKLPNPVFQTNEENGQFGPGHNSFTVNESGEDVLIYHCRNYKEITGDPLYDPNRHTRAQVFHWNEDGTPNFGAPVKDD